MESGAEMCTPVVVYVGNPWKERLWFSDERFLELLYACLLHILQISDPINQELWELIDKQNDVVLLFVQSSKTFILGVFWGSLSAL